MGSNDSLQLGYYTKTHAKRLGFGKSCWGKRGECQGRGPGSVSQRGGHVWIASSLQSLRRGVVMRCVQDTALYSMIDLVVVL